MPASDTERRLAASIAANESWAQTENRSARTAPARRAFDQRFLDQAGGDPVRAEYLRKAFYQRLALRSVRARRRASELSAEAAAAEEQLAELDGGA